MYRRFLIYCNEYTTTFKEAEKSASFCVYFEKLKYIIIVLVYIYIGEIEK